MLLLLTSPPYKSFSHRLRTAFLWLGIPVTVLVLLPIAAVLVQDIIAALSDDHASRAPQGLEDQGAVVLLAIAGGVAGGLVGLHAVTTHFRLLPNEIGPSLHRALFVGAAAAFGLSGLLFSSGTLLHIGIVSFVTWEAVAVEFGIRWFIRRRRDRYGERHTDKN